MQSRSRFARWVLAVAVGAISVSAIVPVGAQTAPTAPPARPEPPKWPDFNGYLVNPPGIGLPAAKWLCEEMGATLVRSSLSPNIRERRDLSCAVFDTQGRMIAQAAHIPVHLGAMPASVAASARGWARPICCTRWATTPRASTPMWSCGT